MPLNVASQTHQIETISYAHSSAVAAALTPMLLGGKVVVALNKSAANELNSYVIKSRLTNVPKPGSQAWTIFASIYWDDTNKVFTTASSGNTLCGYATAAVSNASNATTGSIYLLSLNP